MPAAAHSTTPLYADWRERYQDLHKIGSGGFADVYSAWDAVLERPVALKVVGEGRGMSGRIVARGRGRRRAHAPQHRRPVRLVRRRLA